MFTNYRRRTATHWLGFAHQAPCSDAGRDVIKVPNTRIWSLDNVSDIVPGMSAMYRTGAKLMIEQGLFDIAKPDAMIGLHVMASLNSGVIGYKPGPLMAGSDAFSIKVTGSQTHGSRPWAGIDPISVSGQIITGLQTIVSRQIDITQLPAVVTVGAIKGGILNEARALIAQADEAKVARFAPRTLQSAKRHLAEAEALERVIFVLQANITDETQVLQTIVDAVVQTLGYAGAVVATGRFRTEMQVSLVNDGPVTVMIER